jgi:UDP-glucose 4-epimerase
MKVLITGGTGFIGSHTAVALLADGHQVVMVDNFSNSDSDALANIRAITGQELAFHLCDIRDYHAMAAITHKEAADAVIHFAAFKCVGDSVADPLGYYDNNVNGLVALLRALKGTDTKQFVFSSSATVYGASTAVPFKEDLPLSASNPYGYTKIMCEQILRDACIADSKLAVTLLRYFNPVGAHESGLLGENPKGTPNNVMPYISQVAAGIRSELSIFGNDYPTPDGTGVRDYIHVMDVAEGHVAALGWTQENHGCMAVNLGTGIGNSVLELITTYERENKVSIPHKVIQRRPGDIATSYADPTLAKSVLGWSAKRNLEVMCQDAWRFQKHLSSLCPVEDQKG